MDYLQTIDLKDILAEQWEINFEGTPLLAIKRSTIYDGGYGLFAANNFKKNQCIGLYHGKRVDMNAPFGKYQMVSTTLGVKLDPEGEVGGKKRNAASPIYFGLHFCNDATKCEEEGYAV